MKAKRYSFWLWTLFGFFLFRVLAQLVQAQTTLPFLPPFESWHSAVIPYPLLLLSQVIILGFLANVTMTFSKGQVTPSRTSGRIWLGVGTIYFGAMMLRLIFGLTLCSDQAWFSNYLPTFFHLVLAAFLLVVGTYHIRYFSIENR